jgi:D-sedoheptulose 7-phosphate isomerase
MSSEEIIRDALNASILVKQALIQQSVAVIQEMANQIIGAYERGGKLALFGNGGSAADAQHVAGELVNRFLFDRPALPAIALTTDSSILTCVGNDSTFDQIFARQVEALVNPEDVAVGISTSGNSANVLAGVKAAREKGAFTIGLSGQHGGRLKDSVDLCLLVPSESTPRIQEAHITVLHVVCQLVEQSLFEGDKNHAS